MKKFISIILSILLFITLFLLEINIILNGMLKKDNIQKISTKINFTSNIDETNIISENSQFKAEKNKLYDKAKTYSINKTTVDNFINSTEAKEFISSYISMNVNQLINSDELIKQSELKINFDNMVDKYLKRNTLNLSNNEKSNVKKLANEYSNSVISNIPTNNIFTNVLNPTIIDILKLFLSITTRIILVITTIILILLIFIIQMKNNKWLLYVGNTLLTLTIFTIIFTLSINPITKMIINYIESFPKILVNPFSNNIMKSFIYTDIIIIILSIIYLVIYEKTNKRITKIK